MATALYVYGVTQEAVALDLAALGEGVGGAGVRLLQPPAAPSLSREPRGLAALVSDIAPGPVAQTRRNMVAHTALLERAMAQATILPVRFGTVAPGETALANCISVNAAGFHAALRDIDGRVELGVKASWREGVVFAEIVAADAELCRLRDRLRSRPASETYYERVELGRRIEAALVQRRAAEAAAILAALAPLAEREVELRTVEEDMILNRAFLVRRENEASFDARIEALAERTAARVSFRYVGPVPPYNFVHLQADWLAHAHLPDASQQELRAWDR
jgi:hypothetical protein